MEATTIGERIKALRKERNLSVDYIAAQLGISVSTFYRYESSSIEKIPVTIFNQLCDILEVTPAVLMGNAQVVPLSDSLTLPGDFKTPQEAIEFLLRMPTLAAFGGYDPNTMDDATIVEFANEILQQLKLVSYKYHR